MGCCIPKFAGKLMRTFLCVKLPQSHIDALASWINERKKALPDSGLRWVAPETIHITLKFCGEIPQEMAKAVEELFDKELPRGQFALAVSGIGGFPKLSAPRVIWTGISGEIEKLSALASSADKLAARRGIERERRKFSPHITLARRNETSPLPIETLRELERSEISLPSWTVSEAIFMQSELTPKGPIYTPLKTYKL